MEQETTERVNPYDREKLPSAWAQWQNAEALRVEVLNAMHKSEATPPSIDSKKLPPFGPIETVEIPHVDWRKPGTDCVLDAARALVYGDRATSYGPPRENHGLTAALWSAYLGVAISARQVCLLNVLQKISRDAHKSKRDNLIDVAGYAENADLVG